MTKSSEDSPFGTSFRQLPASCQLFNASAVASVVVKKAEASVAALSLFTTKAFQGTYLPSALAVAL